MTQTRDAIGQYAPTQNSAPELDLDCAYPDVEGLRATLVDFLEGSLPGFGFHVTEVDTAVNELVSSLVTQHLTGSIR